MASKDNPPAEQGVKKKPRRGTDTTGMKRLGELRSRMVRMPEVYLTPEAHQEVEAMLKGGIATSRADLMRDALHEKFLRFKRKESA